MAALIETQRPDLASLRLTHLAHGWDNVSYRLGDDRVVRLPRRDVAVPLISNEAAWLPVVAPVLSLPVPVPEFIGRPGEEYPWPWLIVPFLNGTPSAVVDEIDHVRCSSQMAEFLVALVARPRKGFPSNPFRAPREAATCGRGEPTSRAARHCNPARDRSSLEGVARRRTHDGEPLWIHGDLHPLNVLIEDRVVSGVIDFGDITAGDPATDLALVWSLLATAQDEFWDVYGGDDALRLGPRLGHRAGSRLSPNSADNPVMDSIGRATIEAVSCAVNQSSSGIGLPLQSIPSPGR